MNIKDDWFYQQWYSNEERQQLQDWINTAGNLVTVELTQDNKYSGFHILDTGKTIDLGSQPTKEDCCNWMTRLGMEVKDESS